MEKISWLDYEHLTDAMIEDEMDQKQSQKQKQSPQSPIDLAVHHLLPLTPESKGWANPKTVHDMDKTYVRAAARDMLSGDALILINVPKGHLPNLSCGGASLPTEYRLRCPSSLIRRSGFDLFPRMLDDERYQKRKRARLAAKQELPDGVDYVLHLGPSDDEDLQSAHLETLTISKGIARWSKTQNPPLEIDRKLVAGHDDCCECNGIEFNLAPDRGGCIWDSKPASLTGRDVEDYCEARHAANVVRLLRYMTGLPGSTLVLDSAPRVFTLTGLAKLFEVTLNHETEWLRDGILTWFSDIKNKQIVEILTEDSIIMAYNLLISPIARAAYRLLVSEHAMRLHSDSPAAQNQKFSVLGRPLRDINDDAIQTAIEHGGHALADRVLGLLQGLESDDVFNWLGIKDWCELEITMASYEKRLETTGTEDALEGLSKTRAAFNHLRSSLLDMVAQQLDDAGRVGASAMYAIYEVFASTYKTNNYSDFGKLWNGLDRKQKALTSFFWSNLGRRWPRTLESIRPEGLPNLRMATDKLNCLLHTHRALDVPYMHTRSFNIYRFLEHLETKVAKELCYPLWSTEITSLQRTEFQHISPSSPLIVTLTEDELRFLPLWAGGLNDGSGGVYDSVLPPDTSGAAPIGPGPGYHTGRSLAPAPSSVGDLRMSDLDVRSYTTTAETNAAGRATCSSIAPSTAGPPESVDMEYREARFVVPAEHQAVGQAVADLVVGLQDGGSVGGREEDVPMAGVDNGEYPLESDDAWDNCSTPSASTVDVSLAGDVTERRV